MAAQQPKIQVARKSDLTPTSPTPGIERSKAFETERAIVVNAHVEAGVASGWHHHGDRDVYGYLISGSARLEFGPGGHESVELSAGDFVYVPAGLVHRDINPDPNEDHRVMLVFAGTGPLVVNVDGPESE